MRTVVAAHRPEGPTFVADGPSPKIELPGASIWRLLRLDGPASSVDDGAPAGGPPAPLPSGGLSAQVVELAPRQAWPDGGGWRTVPTLDLHVVLDGMLLVSVEDGCERILAAGESLILRGTTHRLRPHGDRPVRLLSAHLMPGTGQRTSLKLESPTDGRSGVRRVVTGVDADGRSTIASDGEPSSVFRPGASVLTDVWETGGPLVGAGQGGDPVGAWQVEPVGGGVKLGIVELPPGDYTAEANWHSTATIDVDVIVSGRVELHLPDRQVRVLGPGDVVVQRGTLHRWQPIGDSPLRMATLMVAVGA